MSSPLVVPLTTISNVRIHPQADSLDIATVLGWQVVVGKGTYKEGDLVVFFSPDTMLPFSLSEKWGVTQYLSKGRIRATRLRGEPSFGLVMPWNMSSDDTSSVEIGTNVAEYFPGVEKWEPPLRVGRDGIAIPNEHQIPKNPLFPEYTHIHNLRNYPDVLSAGEPVIVTEKLHGTNSRVGMINGEWVAGSHRVQRGEEDKLYWSPRQQVQKLVEDLGARHKQVMVYGEILGDSVQTFSYDYDGYSGYRAFDILVDGRYLDHASFIDLCMRYGLPHVPILAVGGYAHVQISDLAQGPTKLGSSQWTRRPHMREGVVVRPILERTHPKIGRVILKYVSDDFLLSKHSDYQEV